MKIALFKNITFTFEHTTIVQRIHCTPEGGYGAEYVRASDWIDVDFPLLAKEVVVDSQLKALDGVEAELRNKFQDRLNQIEGERQKLRALVHEVVS